MSNEIKVGDKVRVREDAPKILRKIIPLKVFDEYSEVIAQDDEMAVLWTEPIHKNLIPLKYLVKGEEEAKEPKFKVGDKVRKKKWDKDTTISYVEWHGTWQTYVYRFAEQEYGFNCHKEGDITLVSRRAKEPKFQAGDCVKISFEWGELPVGEKLVIKRLETINCRNAYMYSIEGYGGTVIESMLRSYTEPTERTEAKEAKPTEPKFHIGQRVRHILTRRVDVIEGISQSAPYIYHFKHMVDPINGQGIFESDLEPYTEPTERTEAEKKPNVGSIKIPVEVDLTDSYWDAYAADIAKEVALKVANRYNDPKEAAEYAVSVAKAVAEGLKRE